MKEDQIFIPEVVVLMVGRLLIEKVIAEAALAARECGEGNPKEDGE